MKTYLVTTLLLALRAATTPTKFGDLSARAIGDSCKAPEGTGNCQKTSSCKGISYPTNLCPKDPNDVQCCVELTCTASGQSGYCRSVKNNGCPDGTFHPGTKAPWPCPGNSDIQCCIKAPTPPPPLPSPPPDCKKTLSCTFAQIEAMSMQERLDYVRIMQSTFFVPLGCQDQFRAIEGVIMFFQQERLGAKGSWVSYVDAGIVEAIQRGGAIALGMSSETGGNPGSQPWADFMKQKKAGQLGDRNVHDKAWSIAEQTATEYGKKLGDDAKLPVTPQLQLWYWSTQLFRWIMRNRQTAINLLRAVLFFAADDFVNWLTDITKIEPTLCGATAIWTITDPKTIAAIIATGAPGPNVFAETEVIKAILKIYKCFKDN